MEFLVHNISHSDLIVELSWLRDDAAPSASASATVEAVADHLPPSDGAPASATPPRSDAKHHIVTDDGAHVPLTLLARPKFSLFQQISQAIMDRVEELRGADEASQGGSNLSSPQPNGGSASNSPTLRAAQPQLHPSMLDIVPEYGGETRVNGVGRARRVRWKAKCHDTQSPIGFKLNQSPIPVADLQDFHLHGGLDTVEIVQKHWHRVGITAVYFPLIALLLPKWLQVLREFKSENSKQLVYLISGAGIPRNVTHSMQGNSTETTAKLIAIFVHQYYPQMEVHQVHSGSNIFRFDDNVQFMTRELRPRLEAHRDTIVERSGEAWKSHFHVTIAYADGPPARLSALNASLRIFRPSYLHVWQLKTYWHERKLSMDDVDFHAFENIEAQPSVYFQDADTMTQLLVREMRAFRDAFLQGESAGEVGSFWLRKSRKPVLAVLLIEKEDEHGRTTLVAHRGMNCEVSMPTGSLCAERNAIGSALARDPTLRRHALKMIGVLALNLSGASTPTTSPAPGPATGDGTTTTAEAFGDIPLVTVADGALPPRVTVAVSHKRPQENANLSSPRKPKRPRTFSCDDASVEAALRQPDAHERNPLAPCGACKEWLLKIAEANPAFRVVTFENARCRNVYINQIM